MILENVIGIVATAFFYAYLSTVLPEKFGPLKIFYFLMSLVFIIGVFWCLEVHSNQDELEYTIANQKITYNGTQYTAVDVTVRSNAYYRMASINPEFIIANAVVVIITVLFLLYLYSKEMMLQPAQTIYSQIQGQENRDKKKPGGSF